jgi:hypothetical protein
VTDPNGSGHEVMKKVQAEPGQAPEIGRDGKVVKDTAGQIVYENAAGWWVGTGRTVFDNKGNPVKKCEPYFSATFELEDDTDLVNGASRRSSTTTPRRTILEAYRRQ